MSLNTACVLAHGRKPEELFKLLQVLEKKRELTVEKGFLSIVKSNLKMMASLLPHVLYISLKMQALAWHSACIMNLETLLANVTCSCSPRDEIQK